MAINVKELAKRSGTSSMMLGGIGRRLQSSPYVIEKKRFVRAAGRRLLRKDDQRIVKSFPMFAPWSAGSAQNLAELTIQAAKQTFPLILELLSRADRTVPEPIPVEAFADTDTKRAAAVDLKRLFDRYGSDKATAHNYHLLYGAILADPDSVVALLEIGVGTNNPDVVSNMGLQGKPGASLRAFRDFLPKANIYGADIDRRILFSDERIITFFVDQTDPGSFESITNEVNDYFDLIIDDGLHAPNANLTTLLFGLPRLKVGGWLVVEDIAPAVLPMWQLISMLMPQQYNSHVVASGGGYLFSIYRIR